MVGAHMDLSEGVLDHVRGLQQHLIELRVFAARHGRDRLAIDRVGRGAGLRLDGAARFVQSLRRDLDFLQWGWSEPFDEAGASAVLSLRRLGRRMPGNLSQ